VDGSSTGTSVPWMWALLRLPRFRGASHADDNDNRFRHRQVSFPGRRPTKVAAIVLANKIVRMVWAMMARGERYKEPVALAR
jgi:hypothetical protein